MKSLHIRASNINKHSLCSAEMYYNEFDAILVFGLKIRK